MRAVSAGPCLLSFETTEISCLTDEANTSVCQELKEYSKSEEGFLVEKAVTGLVNVELIRVCPERASLHRCVDPTLLHTSVRGCCQHSRSTLRGLSFFK